MHQVLGLTSCNSGHDNEWPSPDSAFGPSLSRVST
jgi:hypothetical protein